MQNLSRTPDRIDALLAAFAAAEYVVEAGGDRIVVRVGESAPALDSLLGDRPWAVITAHNPDGRMPGAEANEAAQRSLEKSLREMQPAALIRVCNRDPDGLWPDEPAWLFTPKSMSAVDQLARRFGQRALLIGGPGEPARLRIYRGLNDAFGTPTAVDS